MSKDDWKVLLKNWVLAVVKFALRMSAGSVLLFMLFVFISDSGDCLQHLLSALLSSGLVLVSLDMVHVLHICLAKIETSLHNHRVSK